MEELLKQLWHWSLDWLSERWTSTHTVGTAISFFLFILAFIPKALRFLRTKIIVIEIWGLRDKADSSLDNAIPWNLGMLFSKQPKISIDLCQWVKSGEVVEPEKALEQLKSLSAELKNRENKTDSRYLSLIYGSLAPVPYVFLAGVLMGNKRKITIFDWDREKEGWRKIDAEDDNKRFYKPHLNKVVTKNTEEIAVAVSISYPVFKNDVQEKIGGMPIVELKLEDISTDNHWSEKKQTELVKQFMRIISGPNYSGIKLIHLFIAAPNSIICRFGRHYDDRNLPKIIVYQYQRNANPRYPWGVLMPVGGVENAEIIYS